MSGDWGNIILIGQVIVGCFLIFVPYMVSMRRELIRTKKACIEQFALIGKLKRENEELLSEKGRLKRFMNMVQK